MKKMKSVKIAAVMLLTVMLLGCMPVWAASGAIELPEDSFIDSGVADAPIIPLDASNEMFDDIMVGVGDDNIFLKSPTVYDHTLARASMYLSYAAYESSPDIVIERLGSVGFTNAVNYNYNYSYSETDNDVVAYTFARKTLTDGSTVVAVIIRGTHAEEWYSNFNVADSGDSAYTTYHEGFYRATQKLLADLTSYTASLTNIRYWVTGHSRGAAVANLVAADLSGIEDAENCGNVFGYTFETPNVRIMGDSYAATYTNIYNICNDQDFIAYMPLKEWGYTKYGTTLLFPSLNSEKYNALTGTMKTLYQKLEGSSYTSYTDGYNTMYNNMIMNLYNTAENTAALYTKNSNNVSVKDVFTNLAKLLIDYANDANLFQLLTDKNNFDETAEKCGTAMANLATFVYNNRDTFICNHNQNMALAWLLSTDDATELFDIDIAEPNSYDYNGDGSVNVLDLIFARNNNYSQSDFNSLRDYLFGLSA